MDGHSSKTGAPPLARTPYTMPGMECISTSGCLSFSWNPQVGCKCAPAVFLNFSFRQEGENDRKDKLVRARKVAWSAKESDTLSVYCTICGNILKEIYFLKVLACVENFDIITLTKTLVSRKVLYPKVKFVSYTLFYNDREHRRGGGVALLARDTLRWCINNKIKADSKIVVKGGH